MLCSRQSLSLPPCMSLTPTLPFLKDEIYTELKYDYHAYIHFRRSAARNVLQDQEIAAYLEAMQKEGI